MSFELQVRQRQAIARRLAGTGFGIQEFSWSSIGGQMFGWADYAVPVLTYRATHFQFVVGPRPHGGYYVFLRPAAQLTEDARTCGDWTAVEAAAQEWALALREEVEAVDPWTHLAASAPHISGPQPAEPNTFFSQAEQRLLALALDKMARDVATIRDLTADQRVLITSFLEEQKTAADRLGRRDWKGQFVGWVVNLFTTLALSEEARQTIGLAATAVLHAFGAQPPHLLR
jgi:hypothetical protein